MKIVRNKKIEKEKMEEMRIKGGWREIMRNIIEEEKKIYKWWRYREKDWDEEDRGRRMENVWG